MLFIDDNIHMLNMDYYVLFDDMHVIDMDELSVGC